MNQRQCATKPTRMINSAAGGSGKRPTNRITIQTATQNLTQKTNPNRDIGTSLFVLPNQEHRGRLVLCNRAFGAKRPCAYRWRTEASADGSPPPLRRSVGVAREVFSALCSGESSLRAESGDIERGRFQRCGRARSIPCAAVGPDRCSVEYPG